MPYVWKRDGDTRYAWYIQCIESYTHTSRHCGIAISPPPTTHRPPPKQQTAPALVNINKRHTCSLEQQNHANIILICHPACLASAYIHCAPGITDGPTSAALAENVGGTTRQKLFNCQVSHGRHWRSPHSARQKRPSLPARRLNLRTHNHKSRFSRSSNSFVVLVVAFSFSSRPSPLPRSSPVHSFPHVVTQHHLQARPRPSH